MKKVSQIVGASLCGLIVVCGAAFLWAGISIPHGEMAVRNLAIGRVYVGSRDVLGGRPYRIDNRTDGSLDFTVDVSAPDETQLVKGYEPIPDARWVTIARPYFSSEAGQPGTTDFYISIPEDPAHLGKRYQVQVTARTIGTGFLQMALGGRALLTILDKEVPWSPEEKENRRMAVRLRLEPETVHIQDVRAGEKRSLDEFLGQALSVRNDSEYPARCRVRTATLKEGYMMPPAGYKPFPQDEFLRIKSATIRLPPRSRREIRGVVRLPDRAKYRGGRFYTAVKVESLDQKAPVEHYCKIFFRTE